MGDTSTIEGLFLSKEQIIRINGALGRINVGVCDPPTLEGLTGLTVSENGVDLPKEGLDRINGSLAKLDQVGEPLTVHIILSL